MHAIIFLGNPGPEYVSTRHNVGFIVGEAWRASLPGLSPKDKFHSLCYTATVDGYPMLLLFPQTFMNLSGKAVQAMMAFHKVPPSQCLVVYDDLDIPFGTLRFREKGSAGTHNGMRSIVGAIGQEFPRLRVGIGPKPEGYETSGFVLGRFSPEETQALPNICQAAVKTIQAWVSDGKDAATRLAAMSRIGV